MENRIIKSVAILSEMFFLSSVEILAVIYGLKPAMAEARAGTYGKDFIKKVDEAKKILKELNLEIAISRWKYIVNSPEGIFKEIELNDRRKGSMVIGIAKDKKKAIRAVDLYHWKMTDISCGREFGALMGYPECCLDFGEYLSKGGKNNQDNFGYSNPAIESLKRSKEIYWQLNVFSNFSLLSHYPCSLSCQKSIRYVDNLIKIYNKLSPGYTEYIKKYLKDSIYLYWSCADVIRFHGNYEGKNQFTSSTIRYKDFESSIRSKSFYEKVPSKYTKYLKNVQSFIERGNKIIMKPNYFDIYKGSKKLVRFNKGNEFMPILVKASH